METDENSTTEEKKTRNTSSSQATKGSKSNSLGQVNSGVFEVPSIETEEVEVSLKNNRFANVNIERRSSGSIVRQQLKEEEAEEEIEVEIVPSAIIDIPVRKLLSPDDVNPMIKWLLDHPVYPLDARATELEGIITDDDDYEFDQVLRANNDDPHAYGQPPVSFLRKVLAIVCYPKLLADNKFPEDVKARARLILKECKGHSIGSFTSAAGIECIRKHVAKFIEKRDEVRSKWKDVVLTAGSTDAIRGILKLIACNINGKKTGVMIPMPTKLVYPIYVQKNDMQSIGYYLNEENNWSIDIEELERAYTDALDKCTPRAIIVVNPGQPTGNVLPRGNIEQIIMFAYDKQLLICADEVNQFDIFADDVEFISFKKVLKELGIPYSKMEMASVASASRGILGEVGLRGGFVEFINVSPDVKKLYMTYIDSKHCPPVLGQVAVDVLVNPPLPEEPSYNEYINEKMNILELHRIQATMVSVAFNSFSNFKCNPILAGRHAFPSITFPLTALQAAEEEKQAPDLYYTLQLLETKGICVSPGCDYGEKENTYHVCVALGLPPDDLNLMLGRFKQFNVRFNERFACRCKKRIVS